MFVGGLRLHPTYRSGGTDNVLLGFPCSKSFRTRHTLWGLAYEALVAFFLVAPFLLLKVDWAENERLGVCPEHQLLAERLPVKAQRAHPTFLHLPRAEIEEQQAPSEDWRNCTS